MDMDDLELRRAVDASFERLSEGLTSWSNPHARNSPHDDEYSRVTDARKWLIVGVRCDAWMDALAGAGLGVVERDVSVSWEAPPNAVISVTDRIIPNAVGALEIVVARGRIGDVVDAGVTIGVGDPVVDLVGIPDCGCDACDSGSQIEIDLVDDWIGGIVSGAFRRLSKGDRHITVIGADGWSAVGLRGRDKPEKIIADAKKWTELSGSSWLDA